MAEHVDLGYAVTAHRAQGITVDTAHVLVEPTMTRENFYVAMTRGKRRRTSPTWSSTAPTTSTPHPHPGDNADATARSVLYGVLQHVGAELSAHETITAEQEQWGSIAQLAAEYETIAAAAQHDRWATSSAPPASPRSRPTPRSTPTAFGALTAELRRAEANHHDIDDLLPRLVARAGSTTPTTSPPSSTTASPARPPARPGSGRARKAPRLIAGLIPEATGPWQTSMRRALDERRELIEARADARSSIPRSPEQTWTRRSSATRRRVRQDGGVATARPHRRRLPRPLRHHRPDAARSARRE